MKPHFLDPVSMAEIYFNRMHFRSIKEVSMRLEEFERYSQSWRYWRDVLGHLKSQENWAASYLPLKQKGEVQHV